MSRILEFSLKMRKIVQSGWAKNISEFKIYVSQTRFVNTVQEGKLNVKFRWEIRWDQYREN